MVLVLMLFDLNIMAKAIVGLMIVFCIFVMRSIQTAYQLPDDIDPDTMLQIRASWQIDCSHAYREVRPQFQCGSLSPSSYRS